jgi:hypothetical protein
MDLLKTRNERLGIDPDDVHAEYSAKGFDRLSDEQLFDLAARVVSVPKQEPADSFILHAPLELLGRRALLRSVSPGRREAVRERMIWVAATYEGAGEPMEAASAADFASPAVGAAALVDAIAGKDLDATDRAATWLGTHAATDAVMTLADPLLDSLAAAGHGSIYFSLLARTAAQQRSALGLIRPLAREIARFPELRIEWVRDGLANSPSAPGPADNHAFAAALANTPQLGLPGTDFIFPTVYQVDGVVARDVIAPNLPTNVAAAGAPIMRVAASSMLQDDPPFAPYGWTHCLTLPQAVLNVRPWLSDWKRATAIAATYVVAFRAAEGAHAIDPEWRPAPTRVALDDALDADPDTAASAVFHAGEDELEAVIPELCAHAGSHHDAHLAKYTQACMAAASGDPAERRLYLAAAAYLRARWSNQ